MLGAMLGAMLAVMVAARAAASRAAMPAGNQLGVRSMPHTAAMNINVNVSWFSADRLCRSFNNPESTVKQRFEVIPSFPKNPVNMQLDQAAFNNEVAAVPAEA